MRDQQGGKVVAWPGRSSGFNGPLQQGTPHLGDERRDVFQIGGLDRWRAPDLDEDGGDFRKKRKELQNCLGRCRTDGVGATFSS